MFDSQFTALAIVTLGFLLRPVQATAINSRADVTREVYIPSGENLTTFCANWNQECIDLAHREGKAYDVCSAGYDGAGTARVDCLALNGETPAPNFTDQVVAALGITYVS